MNSQELFHRWAHQVKPKGKAGNVFYEGPVLYSYGHHYPAAVLTGKTDKETRKQVVLVNSCKYSVTTSSHVSSALCAVSHMIDTRIPAPENAVHPSNLTHLNKQTEQAVKLLSKARTGIDYHERSCRERLSSALLFRRMFLKGKGKVYHLPKDFDQLVEKARERENRYLHPTTEEQERRRKDAEKRAEKKAIAQAKAAENVVAGWRTGNYYVRLPYNLPLMLRLTSQGEVQTSLGATIPLDHAERLYRLVLRVMASGQDWTATAGHATPAGVYKVDSISKDGTLFAGCHKIGWEEIARFAGERGWTK